MIDRLIDWVAFTPLHNVTGEPAISLPLAQSADGMPVGMMLSADVGQEARLLELAYELEQARPWARIQAAGSLVGAEPFQHSFEFALLRRAQFGQDAVVGDADRALRALQQRAARGGQRGR